MADSLIKVGSFPILTIEPNWAEDIAATYILSRRLVGYPGTPSTLEAIAPEVPIVLALAFQCHTKQEEYELLSFFLARKGRVSRFWLRSPASGFTLKTNAAIGATGIYCERNRFDLVYQGYERIYILMSNGDYVVRKVTACIDSATYTYLGFDTVLDRAVTTTNHFQIGRLLLGRFNSDKLTFKYLTSSVSQSDLDFIELVKEYSLAD